MHSAPSIDTYNICRIIRTIGRQWRSSPARIQMNRRLIAADGMLDWLCLPD